MGLIEDVLITTSKKKGCYKIILNSDQKNIRFYEKQGFIAKEIQMVIRH
jgi:hypothetical protein